MQRDRQGDATGHAGAEAIAIAALSYLSGDCDRFDRFLGMTGLSVEDLRQAAGESGFLAGVLAYLMADESLLLAFAADHDLDAEAITYAYHALADAGHETS